MDTPGIRRALAAASVLAATALGQANLPTGVTVEPFYDINKAGLSFAKDQQSVVGLFEVPGKPQHFLVVGYFGYVWTLYPDTTKAYAPGAIKDYAKKQVADFNLMVMKGWEQGALGGAFDPWFKSNRFFYIIYNKYKSPSAYHGGVKPNSNDGWLKEGLVVVERWKMSDDYSALTRDTTLISIDHGAGYGSSNMVFGKDGFLYISADSYTRNSWDSTDLMRKVLRIDVRNPEGGRMYTIPRDNPFYNAANLAVKKEIYAFGFRNTYSLQADYLTGSIWGGEVGQATWEEVNIIKAGRNYGWGNGGDGAPSGNQSIGIEGPCSPTHGGFTATGTDTGSTRSASQMTPYSRVYKGRTYTCADFTNGSWNFHHGGSDAYGSKTALPGTGMSCIILSQAFRGDPASPFHGYHFVTDVASNYFIAVKEGVNAVQMVGKVPSTMRFIGDYKHNGITSFGEDSYGNLYVTMLSSSATGAFAWHDIYRVSHPQLKPLAKPRPQVHPADADPTSLRSVRDPAGRPFTLWATVQGAPRLTLPLGASGVELYDMGGRPLWQGRGASGSTLTLPLGLATGAVLVRYLP